MSPAFPSTLPTIEVPALLESFEHASLELLRARALLRRVDRKFLIAKLRLDDFLPQLGTGYHVLRTAGRAAARYHTNYFDTPHQLMYQDHRRSRLPRYKVRTRHHVDRAMSFLEVKCKKADGRTVKSVMERPFGTDTLDPEARAFIDTHCPISAAVLVHNVSVMFSRATLVGVDTDERLTIDWGLELFDRERRECLPHIAIVEIKQARFSRHTPAALALRQMGVREQPVSKYCLAIARLSAISTNTFRPMLRAVDRLSA